VSVHRFNFVRGSQEPHKVGAGRFDFGGSAMDDYPTTYVNRLNVRAVP
jgi:hypothetical protein